MNFYTLFVVDKGRSMKEYFACEFKNSLPEDKRKRDSFLGKHLYRPISFYFSAAFANMGIRANTISVISVVVVFVSCILFTVCNYFVAVFSVALINIWAILDCVDGNIARTIGSEPYGDFIDAFSSYLLTAMFGLCVSIYVYSNGGVIVEKNCHWIIIIGAIASLSDIYMRLIYHKFQSDSSNKEKSEDETKKDLFSIIQEKFWSLLGFNETKAFLMIIVALLNAYDVALIYMFLLSAAPCVVVSIYFIFRVIGKTK